MLIYLLENQNSLQILFFSDSLCLWLAKSCLITQMSSFFFIMAYFVQKKKNRHLQEKQTYVVIYPFTTSTQDFNKKKYFKVDQKLRNETWPHTFCAGKKNLLAP